LRKKKIYIYLVILSFRNIREISVLFGHGWKTNIVYVIFSSCMLLSTAEPKSLNKALAHSKCPPNHCEIIVKQLALKVRIVFIVCMLVLNTV
jgi:energy-coupling factor transporter transmembrane protein EcfT